MSLSDAAVNNSNFFDVYNKIGIMSLSDAAVNNCFMYISIAQCTDVVCLCLFMAICISMWYVYAFSWQWY